MTTPKWEPPPDGDFSAYVDRLNLLQQQADARARKAAARATPAPKAAPSAKAAFPKNAPPELPAPWVMAQGEPSRSENARAALRQVAGALGKLGGGVQQRTTAKGEAASAPKSQGKPRFLHWSLVLILSFVLIELLDSALEWTGWVSKSVREDVSGYIFLAAVAWLMARRSLMDWIRQDS